MLGLVTAGLLSIAFIGGIHRALAWRKAYLLAQTTGFPVFLSPVSITETWWAIFQKALLPLLRHVPDTLTTPWLPLSQMQMIWRFGYRPFENVHDDTLILATPKGNLLWTCDPEICGQLFLNYPQSQRAVDMVKVFEVYGPGVSSTEGPEWKAYRKAIMVGFNPGTNAAVWRESTQQMQLLIQYWSEYGETVPAAKPWMNRFALHVISAVFFGKNLTWSKNEQDDNDRPPPGYGLRYDQALFTVLSRLRTFYLLPRAFLLLPLQSIRDARLGFMEFRKYMQELQADAASHVDEIARQGRKSVLESIVLATTSRSADIGDRPLPKESILGNIFFAILAGHETTGNTLNFALYLLALYPEYQRRIQEDLDGALTERPFEEWNVDHEYQTLSKGWIGAVLSEVLRLYCVVQVVPRRIVEAISVTDSNGSVHSVPKDTLCLMNFPAALCNPNQWPRRPVSIGRRAELHDSPAIDFDPSQWHVGTNGTAAANRASTIRPLLFAFGQGPHACPGRLFASVEMTAALATLFKNHTIELVMDQATLYTYGGNEKMAMEKTRDDAFRKLVDHVELGISTELLCDLPIRLVRRT